MVRKVYDLARLSAKAAQWRAAAATADPVRQQVYLSLVQKCEAKMEQSRRTPVLAEPANRWTR
jgi:hypothetical protein